MSVLLSALDLLELFDVRKGLVAMPLNGVDFGQLCKCHRLERVEHRRFVEELQNCTAASTFPNCRWAKPNFAHTPCEGGPSTCSADS